MGLLYLVTAVTLGVVCSSQVQAKHDPGAHMDLGKGIASIDLGQSIPGGTPHLKSSPVTEKYYAQSSSDRCMTDFLRKAKQRAMEAVAPEYNRRVRADGKASASRWLARTAREIGRRDGAAAQKACAR